MLINRTHLERSGRAGPGFWLWAARETMPPNVAHRAGCAGGSSGSLTCVPQHLPVPQQDTQPKNYVVQGQIQISCPAA